MGLIGSIVISVIVIVIALVIVELIFNPYYFYSLQQSVTNGASGVVSGVQTAGVKAVVATQSNRPILYITEDGNNTVAFYDMQYNKIIGFVNLNGTTPNNLAISQNNTLYVTGSYYNYHNPNYHGILDIVNASDEKVIGTISMASVPMQIALSTNGTYAYTLNNNNTESEINLQNGAVIGSFPFTSGNVTGVPKGLILSPTENLLFVLVDYSGTCYSPGGLLGSECTEPVLFALNASNINQTVWTLQLTSAPWNVSASSGPKQLAISSDGKVLYVIDGIVQYGAADIGIINTQTKSFIKNVSFGFGLSTGASLSMSPSGDYIYAIDDGTQQNIVVINTSTESIVDTKSTGLLTIPNSNPSRLINFAPFDVDVSSNFTYVVGSDETTNYYLYILNRTNDNLVSLNGLSGCPCEIISKN